MNSSSPNGDKFEMDFTPAIEILFSDQDLVAVNKPAGFVTIRDGYDASRPNIHQKLSQQYGRLWVVHRLDAETSGILLFARSAEVHRTLSLQFELHTVVKVYHLLTLGAVEWQEREVRLPLRVDGDRRHRTIIDQAGGKPAQTDFYLCERFSDDFSLLSAQPHTGYTHQIRAHCAALGLWLIADPLYFPRPYPPQLGVWSPHRLDLFPRIALLPLTRTALHAVAITIEHPTNSQVMTISAPYPDDFTAALVQLRK